MFGLGRSQSEPVSVGSESAGLFVRRPVLSIVLNLLIVVAGIAALSGIEVRELPNVDRPIISIRTDYNGASPETIDKQITALIEGAVARTPGVVSISSDSDAGDSRVTVEFDPGIDLDVAANDLRDAIGNLRGLPEEAEAPRIIKADVDSDAIMRLAATADDMAIEDLTQFVDDRVVVRLAAVPGVADVQVFGDRFPLVRIVFDPIALAARNLTIADLNQVLGGVTLDTPAGTISDDDRTLLVRADASVPTPEAIADVFIDDSTRVGDVADVVYGPAEKTTALRINGRTGIGLGIIRQASSNTLEISNGVRQAVDELNASLPDNISLRVTSDDATFIRASIHEVLLTLLLATAIVIGIIYLFLRSARVTLIPALTVPIALVGTLGAMWIAGFSVNILTLLALVLATGMVVDDAIVVIENIMRQRSLGMGPRAAAVLGTRQVFFAVISTTATLAAVFIPISFFPGIVGRLFSEFGFVLAFAVVLSSIVALTLTPMLASRLVGSREIRPSRSPIGIALDRIGNGAARLYGRLLDGALAAPLVVVAVSLIFAGAAVLAYGQLPQELSPREDRGFLPVFVSAPQGATVTYTEAQMRRVEAAAQPLIDSGEATAIFSIVRGGGGGGFMFLTLAPWDERARDQAEITAELNRRLQEIPGVRVFARTPNSLGIRGGGQGLRFAVAGVEYDAIAVAADQLIAAMEQDPVFDGIRLDYDTTQPQLDVRIDRGRAADLGVPLESIGQVVQTLLSGRDLGDYFIGDQAIEMRAQAPEGMIQDAAGLDSVQVRTSGGDMVPLSALVSFGESAVAPSLPRQDQRRAIPISATLAEGVDLRTAMRRAEAAAEQHLPAGMSILYTGEAKELNRASSGVSRTFAFALIIVLLVLAAQFESFVSALILMFTVPFGIASAIFAVTLTGGSINIYSQIGLVLLIGIMAKNGILIVEFANQLRDQGQSVNEAIRNAATIRLRPVVMTMVSTVLGGLPLIIRSGAGSEARQALGWIIVGGLGFAAIATLFLTPVAYSLLARFSKPRIAEQRRLAEELAAAVGVPLPPLVEATAEEPSLAEPRRNRQAAE